MQPPAALSRHRELLETYLRTLLSRRYPQRLYAMLQYHLGWNMVNYGVAPLVVIALLGSLWLRRS